MNCNSCIRSNTINRCAATIFIPQIDITPDADVTVILDDTTNGRQTNIAVEAAGTTLTIPMGTVELMNGHTYVLEFYTPGDYSVPLMVTVDGQTACCIEFDTRDFEIGGETDETISTLTCQS